MTTDLPESSRDGPCDCGAFFLDVVGPFASESVTNSWTNSTRATNAQLDKLIDQAWEVAMGHARHKEIDLFDGALARLVEYSDQGPGLNLTLAPVTYKEFHGTNQSHADVRYTHGTEVLANPLGVSGAIVTSDGFLILGRRSGKLLQHAGKIHPIGGMVEPPISPSLRCDPFAAMLKELTEETSLTAREVSDISLLGLVRDKRTVQPELIFDISVNTDARQIVRGAAKARDAAEHSEIIPLRNHPAAVVTFMEQNFSQLTPVALATLLLHGLINWGSGWFAAARGYLRSVI